MHTQPLARTTLATVLPMAMALAALACNDADRDGIFVDTATGTDTAAPDSGAPSDGSGVDTPQPLDLLGGDTSGEDTGPDGGGEDGGNDTTTPGAFGTPCAENGDCLDGLCVDTIDGRLCTINCITECPSNDFRCIPITLGGSDPFNACVPKFPNLCKPCQGNDDCRNALNPGQSALCVPAADPREGSFCAAACENDGSCPSGFVCGDVPLPAGGTTKQCLPDDGMCECRPSWAELGLVTDCTTENAFGSCGGTRTCGPDGLTACGPQVPATETCNRIDDDCSGTADDIVGVPCDIENGFGTCQGVTACDASGAEICQGTAPMAEVCNGLDDNCSGAPDEGTCDDGLACTDNVCGGESRQCANPVRDGFCLIGGQCWAENAANPEFPCQRCVSAVSKTSWTGDEGEGASCFIDGECWPSGAGKPNEPCLRCRPNLSTTTWQPADPNANIACNDGLACTKNDRCNGAQCSGEAYTCDDGLSCTDNVCVGDGTCNYVTRNGTCLINGTCYNDGARESNATCSVCDADTIQTRWTRAPAGTTCDDGNICTSNDACSGDSFTCAGTPFSCDDRLACTADACLANGTCSNTLQAGFCLIEGQCYANGAANPENPCLVCNAAVPGGWSLAPAGTSCDDGELCTSNDTCTFGACVGTAYSCDGIGCCVGDGTCTNEAPPGAVEDCSDTLDNDCDGLTDEGSLEQCGDATDNDCDGQTDESGSTWGERFFARTHRVTLNPVSIQVAVYTSNGDGTFQTPRLVDMPDDRDYAIAAIADFDADGFFDLIVSSANEDGSRTYYLSRESCPAGSATLLEAFSLPAGHGPVSFVDMNNDGFVDVAVRDGATNTGYSLLNRGDLATIGFDSVATRADGANWGGGTGGETPAIPFSTFTCGWAWHVGAMAKDMDGDGLVDMIGGCNPNGGSTPASLVLYRGRGDGTFESAQTIPRQPKGTVNVVMAGDFDVDGNQDWIAGLDDDGTGSNGSDPGAMYYVPNRGGASNQATTWADSYTLFDVTPPVSDVSDYPGVGTATVFDFNRDGALDILGAWVPEVSACTANVWRCTDGSQPGFAGYHTRVGLYRNATANPCGPASRCVENENRTEAYCEACRGFCGDRECGSDGCGGTCGSCAGGEVCTPAGQCVNRNECTPQCDGRTCGDNGCGGICGTCGPGLGCVNGACTADACTPKCLLPSGQPKPCGTDGCGNACASFVPPSAAGWVSDDDPHYIQVVAPSNAPPTPPSVTAFIDAPAGQARTMQCTATNIYDIEAFRVEFRWYRNGAFSAAAGNRQILPSSVFRAGESWRCEARAYDGMDYSPWRSSRTLIVP